MINQRGSERGKNEIQFRRLMSVFMMQISSSSVRLDPLLSCGVVFGIKTYRMTWLVIRLFNTWTESSWLQSDAVHVLISFFAQRYDSFSCMFYYFLKCP